MSGNLIIISGPGGVGKGTVVADLVASDDRLSLSRSWTTRGQRPGESDDAYTFVTIKSFTTAIDEGGFLEWDHHFGNYYGSPVPSVDASTDLVLEIDVNGAKQIHDNDHAALFVFIDAPSLEIQRGRLLGRGDPVVKVDERMTAGAAERELAESLPYIYVVNDDVARCANEIAGVIGDYRRLSTD